MNRLETFRKMVGKPRSRSPKLPPQPTVPSHAEQPAKPLVDLDVWSQEQTKRPQLAYLDVARFLLNGDDIAARSDGFAPYTTELMNKDTFEFYRRAFMYLEAAGIKGDYHEYGCFSARTVRMALSEAYKLNRRDMKFLAFDSFEGLPSPSSSPSSSTWVEGAMAMSLEEFNAIVKQHNVLTANVVPVKGFYSESLTSERQMEFVDRQKPIAFVNVDCDLRESAEIVFNFIAPLIQDGTLIYVDDFFAGYHGRIENGTGGAFFDFIEKEKLQSEPFHVVGGWGKSFVVYR